MNRQQFDRIVWEDGDPHIEVTYCRDCEQHSFPAREHCPSCLSDLVEARAISEGTLETFSSIHTPKDGFPSPYTIGFVRVTPDEVRVFSYLTDDVDAYEVGMNVEVDAASFGEFDETWAFTRGDVDA